jgi:hypothetical protein
MSTCRGAGNGAACAAKATNVRNIVADSKRIRFSGSLWRCENAVHGPEGYHVGEAEIHHKSVGLNGGQRDLFMIDAVPQIINPARIAGEESEIGDLDRAE